MARNVKHAGKVSGSDAIRETELGPVRTVNSPGRFHAAPEGGRTPSNGVEEQSHGAVFTTNSTHIPTPNADKPAKMSKVIASRQGGSIDTAQHKSSADLTASQTGSGGPTNKPYTLAQRYDKAGARDSGRLPKNG